MKAFLDRLKTLPGDERRAALVDMLVDRCANALPPVHILKALVAQTEGEPGKVADMTASIAFAAVGMAIVDLLQELEPVVLANCDPSGLAQAALRTALGITDEEPWTPPGAGPVAEPVKESAVR